MWTLVLETSTSRGSLALFEEERLLEQREFEASRGHNSKIFGPLGDLLAGLDGRPLTRLVVGTGPGSYTGVRIALSLANALALSYGAGLLGCCSLVAAEAASDLKRYWVVGDARRRSWYRAEIRDGALQGGFVVEERAAWELAIARARDEGIAVHSFDPNPPLAGVVLDRPSAARLGQVTHGLGPGTGPVEPCYLAAPYITQAKKLGKIPATFSP